MDADEYADLRAALDYAELSLETGDGRQALEQAERILSLVRGRSDDDLLPAALLTRALALESVGRTADAIEALEGIVAVRDPGRRWVRASMTLIWCYREIGDLERSLARGEGLLQNIREAGLDATDNAIKLQVTLASSYWSSGDVRHARRILRNAAATAERVGLPEARAAAFWNLSIIESHDGDVEDALALAAQALETFESVGNHTYAAQLRGVLGTFHLRLEPPDLDAAVPLLEQAADDFAWTRCSPINVIDNLETLARARFLAGDLDGAETLLDQVFSSTIAATFVEVSALALRGQLEAARGRTENARESYRSAVYKLTAIGADRKAAKLWFELGTLLSEVGEPDGAREAFKQAAAATGQLRPRGRFTSAGAAG
ncbi:MAG: tetratricopeptide repeat protein [Nocardioidaceae bacterium]|nr:tetratricopeptide repeat protein [Nocardioidaceae bacterium]